MSKGEYLIVPKGTKFTGSGKLGLSAWAVLHLDPEKQSILSEAPYTLRD